MLAKAPKLAPTDIRAFRAQIWAFYRHSGRNLPWRSTKNPYKILVSEIMLQQTQVSRVLEKYSEFLKKFPTIKKLADAPLAEVLRAWQGMGYNRRARYLHEAACAIIGKQSGLIPNTEKDLRALPGVGHYTANAILTFAFNKQCIFIETNIRRVFIHHFFNKKTEVTDKNILPFVEATLDTENPREWYYALMDYGTQLPKTTRKNANIQSKLYIKQGAFKGSLRELRGKIIRELMGGPKTLRALQKNHDTHRTEEALATLIKDRLIRHEKTKYQLA